MADARQKLLEINSDNRITDAEIIDLCRVYFPTPGNTNVTIRSVGVLALQQMRDEAVEILCDGSVTRREAEHLLGIIVPIVQPLAYSGER